MHLVDMGVSKLTLDNPWSPSLGDIERLSADQLGPRSGGWARQSRDIGVIARRQWAADARTLPQELSALAECTAQIRHDGQPEHELRAAVFFHLRFENIHPLHDGNGRVGRLLLCAQCEQAMKVPQRELLATLHAHENDYKMAFVPDDQSVRFELLLDLLARITGWPPPQDTQMPPFPLTPLHPLKLPFEALTTKPRVQPLGHGPFGRKFR